MRIISSINSILTRNLERSSISIRWSSYTRHLQMDRKNSDNFTIWLSIIGRRGRLWILTVTESTYKTSLRMALSTTSILCTAKIITTDIRCGESTLTSPSITFKEASSSRREPNYHWNFTIMERVTITCVITARKPRTDATWVKPWKLGTWSQG